MKTKFFTLCILFLAMPIFARASYYSTDEIKQIGDFYYGSHLWENSDILKEEGVSVTGYISRNVKNLVIPAKVTYNGSEYNVTCIDEEAFKDYTELESVTIPNTVKYICADAFYGCRRLKRINIPNSVISIHDGAFAKCLSLRYVSIGTGLRNIDGGDYLDVPEAGCFYGDKIDTVYYNVTADRNYTKDDYNHEYEADYFFYPDGGPFMNAEIKNLILGDSVKCIPTGFNSYRYGSSGTIENLIIGKNVKKIYENAFYCGDLKKLDISNGVDSLGYNAFFNLDCDTLTIGEGVKYMNHSIEGKTKVLQWNAIHLNDDYSYTYWYYPNSAFPFAYDSIAFGCNVEYIPAILCEDRELKSINIPSSVRQIGEYAFLDCTELQEVSGCANVSVIGRSAFSHNEKLESIDLPNVEKINDLAFSDCLKLKNVNLGNKLKNMGYGVFDGDESLAYLDIPVSLDTVSGFGNISGLQHVTLHEGIKCISDGAFRDCTKLEEVVVPNSVDSIGYEAFGYTGLKKIVFGEDLRKLGNGVINKCDSLRCVVWNAVNADDNFQLIVDILNGCDWYDLNSKMQIDTIIFGNKVEHIPDYLCLHRAFSHLTTVSFPNSLKTIGNGAFDIYPYYITNRNVKEIILPNNVEIIGAASFQGFEYVKKATLGKNIKKLTFSSLPMYYYTNDDWWTVPALEYLVCYAPDVPFMDMEESEYILDNKYEYMSLVTCYVPKESLEKYKADNVWKHFNLQPISADGITLPNDEVKIIAKETSAGLSFPVVVNAKEYTLNIYCENKVVYCIVFDENGILLRFSVDTSSMLRSGTAQQEQIQGFSYTITGLEPATQYTYTLTATNGTGTVLESYEGTFHTEGYVGVEEVAGGRQSLKDKLTIDERRISVAGVSDSDIRIYNTSGRQVSNPVPTAGVYVVKIGADAVKVVVK